MDKRDKFKEYYRQAKSAKRLPWHHAEPNRFLDQIVEARSEPGTALDMGCGSGVDSVHLARAGWRVTALDFMQEALDMTRAAAADAGVELELVQTDLVEWETDRQFNLILDSGLLHNLSRDNIPAYRKRIMEWLAADGDFILAHWESRADTDRLRGGARRVTREQMCELFAPELEERQFERLEATGLPETVGPDLSVGFYRFRRSAQS